MTYFSWTILLSMLSLSKCDSPTETHNAHDLMGRSDKTKLMNMSEELLIDMKVKQRQIHVIREQHNHLLAYEVGLVIGKIRELYKRMMQIYQMTDNRLTGKFILHPPGIKEYTPLFIIMDMEMVHSMEVEIDKLFHILDTIPSKALEDKSALGIVGPPPSGPTGIQQMPGSRLRSSNITENRAFVPEPTNQNDDLVKQRYRDQYKARSGHRGNWTLDEYYGVV